MFKKSLFTYLLISYFVVLLLPLFINTALYFQVLSVFKTELAEKNLYLSEQIKDEVDQLFVKLENIRTKINLNETVKALHIEDKDITTEERYRYLQTVDYLNAFRYENDFVESIYIYRQDTNFAMGTAGLYSGQKLFDFYFPSVGITLEEWYAMLASGKSIYYPYTETTSNGIDNKNIMCLLPLGPNINPSPWTHLVINVSQQRFTSKINTDNLNDNRNIFIINKDNKIISIYGNNESIPLQYKDFTSGSGVFNMKVGKISSMVTFTNSSNYDWKYVIIEPVSSYMNRVKYIQVVLVLGSLLCIFLGFLLVFYFSKRNYKEVRSIVSMLSSNKPHKHTQNELSFIKENLTQIISDKEEYEKKLSMLRSETKDRFLIELLKGRKYESYTKEEYEDEISQYFSDKNFMVVTVDLDSYDKIYFNEFDIDHKEKLQEVNLIVSNVLEDLLGGYTTSIDGMISCILTLPSLDHADEKLKECEEKCGQILHFLKDNFNIWTTILLSEWHSGLNAIKTCYDETLEALQQKLVLGKHSIISYSHIKGIEDSYTYTIEDEQMLLNCVRISAYQDIEAIVNDIFDQNFKNKNISVHMVKCLIFDIINTILKIINHEDFNREEAFEGNQRNIIDSIINAETIPDMKRKILDVFHKICQYNMRFYTDHSVSLVKQIQYYIAAHYTEEDLNVSSIADNFKLTCAYISKLFKNTTGVSMLEYIHTERINRAKELLREGMNVNTIAKEIGYNNSNAFIRVFKKFEKITPGQYKDSLRT